MNKYGKVATDSVKDLQNKIYTCPIEAWDKNSAKVFYNSKSSQKKGCPKSTFLGLCEEGKVKGVSSGIYTKSIKNKNYGLAALELLSEDNSLTNKELWKKISTKQPNQQMSVVLALFENDLLILGTSNK